MAGDAPVLICSALTGSAAGSAEAARPACGWCVHELSQNADLCTREAHGEWAVTRVSPMDRMVGVC